MDEGEEKTRHGPRKEAPNIMSYAERFALRASKVTYKSYHHYGIHYSLRVWSLYSRGARWSKWTHRAIFGCPVVF